VARGRLFRDQALRVPGVVRSRIAEPPLLRRTLRSDPFRRIIGLVHLDVVASACAVEIRGSVVAKVPSLRGRLQEDLAVERIVPRSGARGSRVNAAGSIRPHVVLEVYDVPFRE